MTPYFMRRTLLTAVIMFSAAAGMAAVPTEPMEPSAAGAGTATIRIEADYTAAISQPLGGNPLWAIPLKELAATRERPIFSPSRRAPAPAAATAPYVPSPQPVKPAEPERPQLSLVGTIAGDKEGFGIFLDRSASTVFRLKTGEQYKGWFLREVRSRETVLEKGDKTATLALPVPPPTAPARHDQGEKNLKRTRH